MKMKRTKAEQEPIVDVEKEECCAVFREEVKQAVGGQEVLQLNSGGRL